MSFLYVLLIIMMGAWLGRVFARALRKDYRNDPSYQSKLQELIERNRQFEDKRNDKRP